MLLWQRRKRWRGSRHQERERERGGENNGRTRERERDVYKRGGCHSQLFRPHTPRNTSSPETNEGVTAVTRSLRGVIVVWLRRLNLSFSPFRSPVYAYIRFFARAVIFIKRWWISSGRSQTGKLYAPTTFSPFLSPRSRFFNLSFREFPPLPYLTRSFFFFFSLFNANLQITDRPLRIRVIFIGRFNR